VQIAKQKKSQIRESVYVILPNLTELYGFSDCSLSQALAGRGVPHSALRATTSGTNVVNLETDPTNMLLHMVY